MNVKTITERLKLLSKFAGFFLLICVIFREHQGSSYVAAFIFIMYIISSIFVEKDKLFLKYLPISLSAVFFLVGSFVCDNFKLWLGEINLTTYYVGAFNLLALYYWILFTVLGWADNIFSKSTKRNPLNIRIRNFSVTSYVYKNGTSIIFFMGLILFLLVFRNPSFTGDYFNRLDYAINNSNRILNILRVFPAIFCPILVGPFVNGECEFNVENFIKKVFVPYIPYILFLIWTGNKYGAFIELIYLFVIPIISVIRLNKATIKKVLKYVPIIITFILILLILYYILIGNSITSSMELIGIRIACQGELWWKLIATKQYMGFRTDLIGDELTLIWQSIVEEAANKNYGVYHLMNMLGAPAVVKYYMARGTRFTASGIELAFYSMGYISFLIMPIIYSAIISYFVNVYANATKEKRVFTSIAAARFIQITLSAVQQGDWYAYFSVIPILFICILIFSQFLSKKGYKNR